MFGDLQRFGRFAFGSLQRSQLGLFVRQPLLRFSQLRLQRPDGVPTGRTLQIQLVLQRIHFGAQALVRLGQLLQLLHQPERALLRILVRDQQLPVLVGGIHGDAERHEQHAHTQDEHREDLAQQCHDPTSLWLRGVTTPD